MNTRNTITKPLTLTLAVVVLLVIGTIWTAERAGANGRSDINDIYIFRSTIGTISEQSFRVSVVNTAISPGDTVVWTYKVTNTGGVPLYESERIQVAPGEFRFSDVFRRDLNTEGEPGTGRAQVMVIITIQVPAGSNPDDFRVSLELMDNHTGATRWYIGYVKVSPTG